MTPSLLAIPSVIKICAIHSLLFLFLLFCSFPLADFLIAFQLTGSFTLQYLLHKDGPKPLKRYYISNTSTFLCGLYMDYGVKFTKDFTQMAWSLPVPWFDITHKHTRTHVRTHTHTHTHTGTGTIRLAQAERIPVKLLQQPLASYDLMAY